MICFPKTRYGLRNKILYVFTRHAKDFFQNQNNKKFRRFAAMFNIKRLYVGRHRYTISVLVMLYIHNLIKIMLCIIICSGPIRVIDEQFLARR